MVGMSFEICHLNNDTAAQNEPPPTEIVPHPLLSHLLLIHHPALQLERRFRGVTQSGVIRRSRGAQISFRRNMRRHQRTNTLGSAQRTQVLGTNCFVVQNADAACHLRQIGAQTVQVPHV